MPADAREQITKLPSGKWRLRYYDRKGIRHSGGAFPNQSAARRHFREVIQPTLGGQPVARRDLTLEDLVDVFLERHEAITSARTTRTIRERMQRPLKAFGDVPLDELELMTDDIALFITTLPPRFRHPVVLAFRQSLDAGIRYGYLTRNPARLAGANPAPPPRTVRVYTPVELKAITEELERKAAAAIGFAAATGLRPAEWAHLERRDVDKAGRVVTVRGTKTLRSRREVPLTVAAIASLDLLPARIDSPYVFASVRGGPFDVENFRKREWAPTIDAAGIAKPARLYDLRSTFASNALALGLTVYELARVMGTSVRMIELHYGALLDTAHDAILSRLDGTGHVRDTSEVAQADERLG